MLLDGKVALITGGRRIGRSLAVELARRGVRVAVTYHRSRDIAEATVEECRAAGADGCAMPADLTDPTAAESVVSRVVDHWGQIDLLLNLVSQYEPVRLQDLTAAQIQSQVTSNLLAPLWVAVAVARQMQSQPVHDGLQGKMLFFSDWAVERPYRDCLPYLVAKGGIVTLTKTLAVELAPTIPVNAIAPGTVEPPAGMSMEQRERVRRASALQRDGSTTDVVRAALFLLEGTDFVTGEVLRIDGGRFLGQGGAATFSEID